MSTEYLKKFKSLAAWLVPFLLAVFLLFGCGTPGNSQTMAAPSGAEVQTQTETEAGARVETQAEATAETQAETTVGQQKTIEEGGSYTDKDSVALYLHTYGRLPDNYITKKQAEAAGWVSKEGNLWEVAPGKSIGGSRFGNYEKKLPEQKGRIWYEGDINFDGSYRGAERIVYSDDGLIYYTGDHYQTFEQLY